MELPDLPESAPRADAGADALAPSRPSDRVEGAPARPFPWPSSSIQAPPSPEAIENARRGTWVMNDYLDGWTLMGANGRPVMRADGSKVAFWFRDIDRLTRKWTPAEGSAPPPTKRRPGLATLDSGFDSDWDPAIGRSYRADVTKSARLLAYYFAQRTEPEEAVRRAVAMVLDDPVMVKEGNIDAFVPKRFNLAATKAVAEAMRTDLVGLEPVAAEIPEPGVPFEAVADKKSGASNGEQPGRGNFDDIADAWLEETLSGVVAALNAEDIEDARVRVHELAGKLKPFAEFTRAIAEQQTAFTSGSFELDKLLGPVRTFLKLVEDPDSAAFIMALATRQKTSQINRKISDKERRDWWKREARENPQNYKEKDLENMKHGRAEKDAEGKSMELHHVDGTPEGGVKKMTFYDHRGGPNYLKNHPWLKKKK